MDRTDLVIEKAKARRIADKLKLVVAVPERPEPYTCYPNSQEKKERWIDGFRAKGCFILEW